LPYSTTVVPIIFGSNITHLTNFPGEEHIYPVSMTIGNIKSTLRNKPTANA
ncbi:hypothetical protein DFH27DRAFT_487736, partial [Peziza echinospora]